MHAQPPLTRRVVLALLAVSMSAVLTIPGAVADAQSAGFARPPTFSGTGVASVVFLGGSLDELEAAASAQGAGGAWAQATDGSWNLLTINGAAFVNARFRSRFEGGFTGPVAIVLTRTRTSTAAPAPAPAPPAVGTWTVAQAPASSTSPSTEWITIAAPGGKTILANVIRPAGNGPFPAVVLLHSQSGYANQYLELGNEIAGFGYVTVIGCWFAGNYDGSSSTDTPAPVSDPDGIACPNGPTLKAIADPAAVNDIAAIVTATKSLPDVQSGRVAIVGNSRGSITGLFAGAVSQEPVHAIVAIGGAPPGGALLAAQITAPVLLLQGADDAVVPVSYAQSLEFGLTALGRTVQSHYYPQAGHGILFGTPYYADVMTRVRAFLGAHLSN